MVYVFLADGFEEIEAFAPVDVLRRGGVEVKTVGITGKTVVGSHGIPVIADLLTDEISANNLEAIVLPGGMPGTVNLEKNDCVQKYIDYASQNNLVIGAICAAPSILGHKGLLKGKNAVCFPGFEKDLTGAIIKDIPAVADGNIVTGWGAGGAIDFALLLLAVIKGDKSLADKLKISMRYPQN